MTFALITAISLGLGVGAVILFIRGRAEFLDARDELYRTKEEKEILIEFLHRTAEYITKGADNEKLYNLIVRATALSCGAMSACVFEKTADGKLKEKATEGLFPPLTRKIEKIKEGETRVNYLEDIVSRETIEDDKGVIAEVARTGVGVLIKDADKDSRLIKHEDDALVIHSFMAVPMKFKGKIRGVLAVANPISGKSFTDTDFSLAMSLGEHAGVAVQMSEATSAILEKSRLDFDLRLASSVQRYILPTPHQNTSDLEFAVKYIPQQLIGGDFYDCFDLPNGGIGLVIGDVSGKGISAAIVMTLCQTLLRNIALKGGSPAQTLRELNAEIYKAMRTDMFVTLIYAEISQDHSKITLARAGHELPLLYKSSMQDSPAAEIRTRGMAVGMVEPDIFNATISESTLDFNHGDVFVMYTDGLTEAVDIYNEEYSSSRLAQTISNMSSRVATDMNTEIEKSVFKFTGGKGYKDDFTLFTTKRI